MQALRGYAQLHELLPEQSLRPSKPSLRWREVKTGCTTVTTANFDSGLAI